MPISPNPSGKVIPAFFSQLLGSYPALPKLNPQIKKLMSHTPGTPCCVQMSWTLNCNGVLLPARSTRPRPATPLDIPADQINWGGTSSNNTYYAHLAVDEVLNFLIANYGERPNLVDHPSSPHPTPVSLKSAVTFYIKARQGVLVFSDNKCGAHVELWDGDDIAQKNIMSQSWLYSQPSIFFWETWA